MAILFRRHATFSRPMDAETSLALLDQAATVLVLGETLHADILGSQLSDYPDQAAQEHCEAFLHLLLAAESSRIVDPLYPIIGRATSLCLRACGDYLSVADTSGQGAEILATAFNISRLILLGDDVEVINVSWARTWPDWQRLLTLSFEANCVNAVSPSLESGTGFLTS
jgi:hypothetical protein